MAASFVTQTTAELKTHSGGRDQCIGSGSADCHVNLPEGQVNSGESIVCIKHHRIAWEAEGINNMEMKYQLKNVLQNKLSL